MMENKLILECFRSGQIEAGEMVQLCQADPELRAMLDD